MSSISANPLSSAGTQQLYNQGLLPTSLSNSVLNNASSSDLSQLANTSIALQQTGTLLGFTPTTSTDSVALSSAATDPLTQAVTNALTSNLNQAVAQFLPQESTTGSQINLVA
jgi:hypothetical protein